jgi:hypothetical protein
MLAKGTRWSLMVNSAGPTQSVQKRLTKRDISERGAVWYEHRPILSHTSYRLSTAKERSSWPTTASSDRDLQPPNDDLLSLLSKWRALTCQLSKRRTRVSILSRLPASFSASSSGAPRFQPHRLLTVRSSFLSLPGAQGTTMTAPSKSSERTSLLTPSRVL